MEKQIKMMTDLTNIINQATRKYLNNLIDVKTTNPKAIDIMDIDMAFDDMNLQTEAYDLNSDNEKFILQINYFTQKAVSRWLQVKKGLDLGNTLDKKDINIVFDQIAKNVLKYTDLRDENPVQPTNKNSK